MTNSGSLRRLAAMMLVPVALCVGRTGRTEAQPAPTYKVGDRIECNVTGKWQPGTIVQASKSSTGMFYVVNNDGEAHTWDRWASASQIRAKTGVLSPTEEARRAIAALGSLGVPKPGSVDEAIQNVIRERYVSQGSAEFPVTVTFQRVLIGQPHGYGRPNSQGESADGPGGNANTTVYPVNAQYYYRTAFRDAYLTSQQDDLFLCFRNAFNTWQCNMGSGKGSVKRYREERAG